MSLGNGQQVTGVVASTYVRLSCNPSQLPGYPAPTPTPTPNISYISCYRFGLSQLGVDKSSVNLRLATNTGLVKSVGVNSGVLLIGYQNDPNVQRLIGQSVLGGSIQPPPSLNLLPVNPSEIKNTGFALIQWDDNDPNTLTKWWWIVGTVVKATPDCTNVPATPTPALPLPTPTDAYQPIYNQQGSIYAPANASVNSTGENPPALMGSRGLHVGNNDTGGLNIDTVELSAEQCIDINICSNPVLYNPNDLIPVFSPVSGCAISNGSVSTFDPTTVIIKLPVLGGTCSITSNLILYISFTHLEPVSISKWQHAGAIHQGDLIGYLCSQNNVDSCNLLGAPTHLALGLSKSGNGGPQKPATVDELLGLLPRLHDCFPKPVVGGGIQVPDAYIHRDLCHLFFPS